MTDTRRGGIWFWLVLLILAAVLVAGGVFLAAAPKLKRERMLIGLTDSSASARSEALAYAVARMRSDQELREAVLGALETEDEKVFLDVVGALDAAGLWSVGTVPCEAWLRWVGLVAEQGEDDEAKTAARMVALGRLAEAVDCAMTHRAMVGAMLEQLAHADVHPDVRYNALIAAATFAARVGADGGLSSDDVYVRVIEGLTGDDEVIIAEQAWIFAGLLGVADRLDGAGAPEVAPEVGAEDSPPGSADEERVAYARKWAREMGASPRRAGLPVLEVEQEAAPTRAEKIELLLRSDVAAERDLGCVLAVKHLGAEEFGRMAEALLGDEDLDSIRSGVMLWAMAGDELPDGAAFAERVKRVSEAYPDEIEPLVSLGWWIRGERPEIDDVADLLFSRQELPMPTTALALLVRGKRSIVLDHLLNPMGQPAVDLYELLVERRWWRVLAPFLPAEALWIDLDGSYTDKRFEIDVLRNWYLLERASGRVSGGQ